MALPEKILVLDVAGLSASLAARMKPLPDGLAFRSMESIFPAVTCTVQAAFRTAAPVSQHGMISNGLYHERLRKPLFWEQSASLFEGPRIWESFRANGGTVGLMFWQQSLGEAVDLIVSPRPIHKHSGGMIQDVYTQPPGLYDQIKKTVGRPFNLMHYWGPLASARSSRWIAEAVAAVMDMSEMAPDLLLAYLPLLDYDLQRFGPDHPRIDAALRELEKQLADLVEQARAHAYEVVIFGDYAIAPVPHGAIFPNRALREANLFSTSDVRGMQYPDFWASRAFAMVDHEMAHGYVLEPSARAATRDVLIGLEGVEQVLDREAQKEWGIDHPNSGEFVLVAKEGYWFAYPWWTDRKEAPDFATHVDIHNKPGFDPCELFFGWPPGSVTLNTDRVRGSHGRSGPGREVAWASTMDLGTPENVIALATSIARIGLEGER